MHKSKQPTVAPASGQFRVQSSKSRERSPGHVNRKGRHQWELLGQKLPKKTEEELAVSEIQQEPTSEEESPEATAEEPVVVQAPVVVARAPVQEKKFEVKAPKAKSKSKAKVENKTEMEDNIETLKDQVEELQVKHAEYDVMMQEIRAMNAGKASEAALAHYISKISDSLQRECGDKPYSNKTADPAAAEKYYQSEDSVVLRDAAEQLGDKFMIIGMNLINTKKFKTQIQHSVYQLEETSKKHMEVHQFRKETEEFEDRIKEYVECKIAIIETKVKEQSEEMATKNKKLEEDLSELQKQTLWKIKDIENLMEKRISEHKVNTLIAALEKKLKQNVADVDSNMTKNNDERFTSCQEQIKKLEQQSAYKVKDLENALARIQSEVDNRSKIDKVDSLEIEIKCVKESLEAELNTIQAHVVASRDKCAMLIKRMEEFSPQHEAGPNKQIGIFPQTSTSTSPGPLKLARQATSATVAAGFHNRPQTIGKLPLQGVNDSHEYDVNTPSSDLNNSLTHKEVNLGRGGSNERQSDLLPAKALRLEKRTSIRAIDIANITRKEKQDLIDGKVIEFETNMEQIEQTLNMIQHDISFIPNQEQYNILRDDKVSKTDIYQYVPDKAQIKKDIERIVQVKMDEVQEVMNEVKQEVDGRLVKIRKEFDINILKKSIEKKANQKDVQLSVEQQDHKTRIIDNNVMMLANDVNVFQKIVSKMEQSIVQLQEINKDVLLGKKNANCLSCSKMNDNFENQQQIPGKDGRLYFTAGASKALKNMQREKYARVDAEDDPGSPTAAAAAAKRGSSHLFGSTTSSALFESQRILQGYDPQAGDAKNRHVKSKSILMGEQERKKSQPARQQDRGNNLTQLNSRYERTGSMMTQSQKKLYNGFGGSRTRLPIGYKVQNGIKVGLSNENSNNINLINMPPSVVQKSRPMTSKVSSSMQYMPGLGNNQWTFSNLNTVSQQNLNQQQFPKYSYNQSMTSFHMGQASATALAQRRPTVTTSLGGDGHPAPMKINDICKDLQSNVQYTPLHSVPPANDMSQANLVLNESHIEYADEASSPTTAKKYNENSLEPKDIAELAECDQFIFISTAKELNNTLPHSQDPHSATLPPQSQLNEAYNIL